MIAEWVMTSRSEAQTHAWAGRAAALLGPGDVVALCGDLGVGKTRFVAGACRALGYVGRVRSPSYTLLNVYRGRWPLYHFDLYRLTPGAAADALDEWEEYLDGSGVSFIEWADRLPADRLPAAIRIELRHLDDVGRRLLCRVPADRRAAWRTVFGEEAP